MPARGGYISFEHVLGNATYVKRVLVLVSVWFFAYVTVFAFSAGFTSLLTALHYPPPEAGMIQAVGALRLPRLRAVRGRASPSGWSASCGCRSAR